MRGKLQMIFTFPGCLLINHSLVTTNPLKRRVQLLMRRYWENAKKKGIGYRRDRWTGDWEFLAVYTWRACETLRGDVISPRPHRLNLFDNGRRAFQREEPWAKLQSEMDRDHCRGASGKEASGETRIHIRTRIESLLPTMVT